MANLAPQGSARRGSAAASSSRGASQPAGEDGGASAAALASGAPQTSGAPQPAQSADRRRRSRSRGEGEARQNERENSRGSLASVRRLAGIRRRPGADITCILLCERGRVVYAEVHDGWIRGQQLMNWLHEVLGIPTSMIVTQAAAFAPLSEPVQPTSWLRAGSVVEVSLPIPAVEDAGRSPGGGEGSQRCDGPSGAPRLCSVG